ncbi:unnamed protein product [Meloidogyne enterolobii]|uniref:Uncharacterized protein n=1 Tax=Meloidogyne enterolobii TaxID=390850 RepID=A0ACB0YTN1_MELEN
MMCVYLFIYFSLSSSYSGSLFCPCSFFLFFFPYFSSSSSAAPRDLFAVGASFDLLGAKLKFIFFLISKLCGQLVGNCEYILREEDKQLVVDLASSNFQKNLIIIPSVICIFNFNLFLFIYIYL